MDFSGPRDQKLLEGSVAGSTTVIYTVPAGKIFWLVASLVTTDGVAGGIVRGVIRNASDVIQMAIGQITVGAPSLVCPGCPFIPGWPIKLTEGWDLAIISDAGSLVGVLNVFGFETDV
jgi:hypothetical protein